uniref:Uncharacterized protein n=1 Tax=Micrurus corallinus TaxID=54390 RepID=A0A2D4EXH5_MICCO
MHCFILKHTYIRTLLANRKKSFVHSAVYWLILLLFLQGWEMRCVQDQRDGEEIKPLDKATSVAGNAKTNQKPYLTRLCFSRAQTPVQAGKGQPHHDSCIFSSV